MKGKSKGKGLIHKSFPEMAAAMPATMGSQSNPPIKSDPYSPDTTSAIPPIDRNAFSEFQ